MKNTKYTICGVAGLVAGIMILTLASNNAFTEETPEASGKTTVSKAGLTTPSLPDKIDFAGEEAPLKRWDVSERLDRELLYNYYNTPNVLYMLKLANRYFPIISERLKANGIPDDFKYLCVAESNLVAVAISKSGATSFWQFMDKTAPEYQLTVNSELDERYDLLKATDAACKYFKQAFNKFGSWTAAAASYNCGMTGYNNQATFQRTTNYYDLHLPEETNRYIYRILTFKHLLSNADALGFTLRDSEKYPAIPFRDVEVTKSIPDLAAFALNEGTNYKILKLMNPWIKGKTLTIAPGKSRVIKIPK